MASVQKGGYAHFMLKEIHEQPQVAREVLHMLAGSPDVQLVLDKMKQARNLYFIGCGTSYHACLAGAVYFARLAGRAVIPVIAPQFIPQYLPTVSPEDVGLFVSQSGETKDVLNALYAAEKQGMQCFGLANVIGSTLTKASVCSLPLCCGYEISVPATKTFTNQVVTFLALAYRLAGRDARALDAIPELMEQTIALTTPQVQAITPAVNAWEDCYSLGYGTTYPMALEGALKLKEITYSHCEGMLTTEFKHGPLSAITEGFPVLFSVDPLDVPVIVSGINEVTCRGGRAIAIGQESATLRANASDLIVLPDASPEISSLLSVLPLQLLSYYMSVARGYDPDFPRNLSKTLTVD